MIGWLAQTWGFDGGTIESSESEVNTEYTVETRSRNQQYTSSRTLDDIIVEGDSRFVDHANRCLEELRGTQWESLVAELRGITQVSSYADSGTSDNGIYEAGPTSMGFGYGAWGGDDCIQGASVLIHEATHAKRMLNGGFDITNYAGEELIALAEQAKFLRSRDRHGAAADLESNNGRHNEAYLSPALLALQR